MARPLKRSERLLPNGITLKSHDFDPETDKGCARTKFRHWTAEKDGVLYGEFKSWQKSLYHPSEKEYGRNGGSYSSKMVKQSWVNSFGLGLGAQGNQWNETMQFWTWTREIKAQFWAYQDDSVKPRDDSVVETVWPGIYMQMSPPLISLDNWETASLEAQEFKTVVSGFDPSPLLEAFAPKQESPDPEQPAA